MADFTCDSCGKCCSSFGSFITIERQLNDRDYYCRYSLTRDLFPVHVDRDYADEVSDRYSSPSDSAAPAGKRPCPFLCRNRGGNGFICTIYDSRPQVCRGFRCYRMLVYDADNRLSGKVIGAGEISTSDETLARLWNEQIVAIPHPHLQGKNDPAWVKKVIGILAAHGYRGDAVE
ncbi:MAG: YkgJ family cysteine cluster protein [Methanoregula sp.]|jgi:Fe-S-cluster containining protein|uniref:YkgJ family cysteine cluster protein n=1 Tax=Methanoregula sp. TaxID=2052170 RepID=UPI0025FAD746|nr:YkgJ family cysteine cluster protein [Methanoregula sp.]MCK9631179.1 YkgJ family cysteine cluster protein [Methanoregula sp.]